MNYDRQSAKLESEYGALIRETSTCSAEVKKVKLHRENVVKAQEIVQVVAQRVQQQAHEQIAAVVSRCLEAVFDEPYQFKILFEKKRGRTEAKLVFVRSVGGRELELDPCDGAGGGVLDVAAFALRLACLMLQRPRRRRVLLLDEPFKMLSKDYGDRVRDLLLQLAKEMKIQIIMVTHNQELRCGKVIELE